MLHLYFLVRLSNKGQIFLQAQGLGEGEFCFFVWSWFSPFPKYECIASQHLNTVWLFKWFFLKGVLFSRHSGLQLANDCVLQLGPMCRFPLPALQVPSSLLRLLEEVRS